MYLATSNNLLLVLWDAQNRIFSTNSRFSGQPKNNVKTIVSTLHHPSLVIFATATGVAFVLLGNSRFNFDCYTQCEQPTQKSARKWQLQPFTTSCAKDCEGRSIMQTSFTERPNIFSYSPFTLQAERNEWCRLAIWIMWAWTVVCWGRSPSCSLHWGQQLGV